MKATAIIPVKRFDSAKSRLGDAVEPAAKAALAEAMFLDALSGVRRSKRIGDRIVVTGDPAAARQARWLGAEVLHQEVDEGHNEAALAGIREAMERGADQVALLPADCPLLDGTELDRHLGEVPRTALIVPDRHGTGTNALFLSPPDVFEPAFGPDSLARHVSRARAKGISFAVEQISSLAVDLDTPEDLEILRDALILNPARAPRTSELIWELGSGSEQAQPATA